MTYNLFLLVFLAPLLLITAVLFELRFRQVAQSRRDELHRVLIIVAIACVVAVLYTSPWDRWLIEHQVWGYPAGSIFGTIAKIPIDEYIFMAGQTMIVGLWTMYITTMSWSRTQYRRPILTRDPQPRRIVYACWWAGLAVAGAVLAVSYRRAEYLGAILLWFSPPLALQAAVGAEELRSARPARLAGIAATVPLWLADAVAIHNGAWWISATQTTGLKIAGLPVEEAVFFLVTNLLVVNTVVLSSTPAMQWRLAGMGKRSGQVRTLAPAAGAHARHASDQMARRD